jgi:hypothetical protein
MSGFCKEIAQFVAGIENGASWLRCEKSRGALVASLPSSRRSPKTPLESRPPQSLIVTSAIATVFATVTGSVRGKVDVLRPR